MSAAGYEPLQKAVYNALVADSALMALVSGVYDRVPEGAALPYVVFADVASRDASNASDAAERIELEINVYSRGGGRKETLDILERLHAALHRQAPVLTGGWRMVWMRADAARVRMLGDGMTWQGNTLVSALIEPA